MTMRFRAHDTFFIRKGWLSKGMKYVNIKPHVFVDKEENPMDILGIGNNMVKALRYWLQAFNLTEEPRSGRRTQSFTDFGRIVFARDRYIEEVGTLYLLHYALAKNMKDATAWYFFFNEFNRSEFTKEDFVLELQNYVAMTEPASQAKTRSYEDDFSCIINTYVSRSKLSSEKISPENNIDCPLGELGLIDILNKEKRIYKKSLPAVSSFNPWVVLAVVVDQAKGRTELSLNELLTEKLNIGRVFNLDSISMIDILRKIEKTGEIKIIRTAGLDVIHINSNRNFYECVEKYYDSLGA